MGCRTVHVGQNKTPIKKWASCALEKFWEEFNIDKVLLVTNLKINIFKISYFPDTYIHITASGLFKLKGPTPVVLYH